MLKSMIAKKKILVIAAEIIMFLAYALFSVATYEQTELTFTLDDMQLQDMDRNYSWGGIWTRPMRALKRLQRLRFR